jgi:hypothetical protein
MRDRKYRARYPWIPSNLPRGLLPDVLEPHSVRVDHVPALVAKPSVDFGARKRRIGSTGWVTT